MRSTIAAIIIAVLFALSALPAMAYEPVFSGCVIAQNGKALPDVECDAIPDPFDNCPLTKNPEQADIDRNGVGDACDLLISDIIIEPEPPVQGRSMVATVRITNNRQYPMRNLDVKLDVPKLGLAATEEVGIINPGERVSTELLVRIPECAPAKPTDVVAYVTYPFAPGQQEVFSIPIKVPIVPSGTCAAEVGDKTIVNILEIQDIDADGALYPFTIHNTQAESKAYVLSVEGHEQWGIAEINPGTVIVIPPGESRDGAIQVWAREGMQGRKSFTLTVQARDDTKQVVLLANIPEPLRMTAAPAEKLIWGLGAFVLILIIVALVLWQKQKK